MNDLNKVRFAFSAEKQMWFESATAPKFPPEAQIELKYLKIVWKSIFYFHRRF